MLFNSFSFVYLFLVTFLLYYIPRLAKLQVSILIVASLIFYSFDNVALVGLLLFSATVNITTSYLIVYGKSPAKKTIALTGVVINLAALALFKYGPLFGKTFFDPDDSIGELLIKMPLPIGISFFTFEGISLVVDVWRGKELGRKIVALSIFDHAKNTLFFISFFPHLVAGPILKAHDFFPQVGTKYFKDIQWESAFKAIVAGYFLKMVVADNLKDFTFWIEYPYFETIASATLITLLFGYSCQIFADFAGYSLIAIGLARLFGYQFNANFNFPYISTSFKDFWKRWHISLSTFLMEYLYYPLGGNRKGKFRTYFNLILTMILGGLWHGAAWSYAVWGFAHGLALAVERFITDKIQIRSNVIINATMGLFVFSYVTAAWVLFKLPDFSHVAGYFQSIARNFDIGIDRSLNISILVYSIPVIIYHHLYLYRESRAVQSIRRVQYIPYAVMVFLILTNSGSTGSFIYFQF